MWRALAVLRTSLGSVDQERSFGLAQAAPRIRRLVDSAGGSRLIGAGMLDAAGTGLLVPLTVLFFVVHVGIAAHLVGLGMSIGGVLTMVSAPLGGHLVDRFGPRRALICGWLLAAWPSAATRWCIAGPRSSS